MEITDSADKTIYEAISDDLFVKMMTDFSTTVHEFRSNEIRRLVVQHVTKFRLDALVMNVWLVTHIVDSYTDGLYLHGRCRLLGIPLRICSDARIISYDSFLMIKEMEPTPVSKTVKFDLL